jgi:hypothetical protein
VSEETPWEFVKRRRAEGATAEALKVEPFARGLDRADVALLLDEPVLGPSVRPTTEVTVSTADGTPWALVQQLKAEGFPREAIVRELMAQGHPRADVEALLIDEAPDVVPDPPGTDGSGAPAQTLFGLLLLVAGVVALVDGGVSLFSAGLILLGLVPLATAFQADRRAAAPLLAAQRTMVPLAPEDVRARCAVHPQYASIGNCPRCGSFACAMCAPARGFEAGVACMRCQALPEVVAARRKKAARQAAAWLLTAPGMLALLIFFQAAMRTNEVSPLSVLIMVALPSAPFMILSGVQAFVRGGWPTVLSVVPWLGVEVSMGVASQGRAVLQLTLWLIPLGATVIGWMGMRQARRPERPLVAPT